MMVRLMRTMEPLHSERLVADPASYGAGTAGTGAAVPTLLGTAPLVINNSELKFGMHNSLGGAFAALFLSVAAAQPGTWLGQIPIHLEITQLIASPTVVLSGSGGGQGYTTIPLSIGNDTTLVGIAIYGQWVVLDPIAPGGVASSTGIQWTIR